MRVQDYMIGCG